MLHFWANLTFSSFFNSLKKHLFIMHWRHKLAKVPLLNIKGVSDDWVKFTTRAVSQQRWQIEKARTASGPGMQNNREPLSPFAIWRKRPSLSQTQTSRRRVIRTDWQNSLHYSAALKAKKFFLCRTSSATSTSKEQQTKLLLMLQLALWLFWITRETGPAALKWSWGWVK